MAQDIEVDAPVSSAETQERKPRRFLVPALIALLVLALATAGTFFFLWLDTADTKPEEVGAFLTEEAPEVEEVTRQVVTLLINYDATNLEQRATEILPLATGSFRQQYEDIISEGLPAAIEEAEASSRGQITQGPDITFASSSEAIALVTTTQTTQSRDTPGGRTFTYVMKITLLNVTDGGWKADRVEILSQQES